MFKLAEKFDKKKLPSEFVERYRVCDAHTLKVAIWALCNGSFDIQQISADLSIPHSAVEKAVDYWLKAGLLIDIESTEKTRDSAVIAESYEIPRLNHIEISNMSLRDPNVAKLIQESQRIIGRNLTSTESARFLSIYKYYPFEPEVLLMMLEYSRKRTRRPFSYLEKMAAEWHESGIVTMASAEKHFRILEQREKNEAEVQSILGQENPLTLKEKQFIQAWFEDFGYGREMISEAFAQTGKASVSYLNSVLRNWYSSGFRTVNDTRKEFTNTVVSNDAPKSAGKSDLYQRALEQLERSAKKGGKK
ncbi:MAG: DnaD domain protein [Oscillospiraceae bacterium]|nr:DnaD domain protein [Oscillospiraceae bacterium]